ncbi:50S ribosomal protein L13 [Linum perenne]
MCIVVNAKDIAVTGRKMTDKIYYRHTGQVSTFIKLLASVNLLCGVD